MEKRIGIVAIVVNNKKNISTLNSLFTNFSNIIIGRMGLPLKNKKIHVISIVVEGSTDEIGAFTGQVGKLDGIQVKSVLTKYKEAGDNYDEN